MNTYKPPFDLYELKLTKHTGEVANVFVSEDLILNETDKPLATTLLRLLEKKENRE